MFVGPKLTADQALIVLSQAWLFARGDRKRFVRLMKTLNRLHRFRLRDTAPSIDASHVFDTLLDDATAKVRFRFTLRELNTLAVKLQLPSDGVTTAAGDRVPRVEALAMVCRRLSEASKLLTVANEFGRSTSAYSRIVAATVSLLYEKHRDLLYFHSKLLEDHIDSYCQAIRAAGAPLKTCWGFIDGSKQYIARPSARETATIPNENLQRSVFNGHPQRHCFNWQSIQAPVGIIVSLFGPVEGRKHDSTLLSLSGVLDVMAEDAQGTFAGKLIYGDPAYGCSTFVCCPATSPCAPSVEFNCRMSSLREGVEWGFGRIKVLWEFMNWDKKQRVRQAPVGLNFFTTVLLFNCHTCMQPLGNQISMYFGLAPPTLEEYLGIDT
jgi:hypothetical protein